MKTHDTNGILLNFVVVGKTVNNSLHLKSQKVLQSPSKIEVKYIIAINDINNWHIVTRKH